MSPRSPEERYQEWLDRLEIPVENQMDIESLKDYLKDEFGITGEAQVAALWDATGISADLALHGIRAVTITYPWGRELRYGVQGMSGLWGWGSVQEIRAGEEW
ncbi:hypothetical protein KKE60_08150 [Patescibacteria group bacterium]|nr:hypothetical protein [Patescibacteria group bacterium]